MTAVLIWSGLMMVVLSHTAAFGVAASRLADAVMLLSSTDGDASFVFSVQNQQCANDVLLMLQLAVAKEIIAKDGAGGLYKGLSAGLLRQATYTTARLGIFQIFSDMLKQQNQGKVHRLSSSTVFDWSLFLCAVHLCVCQNCVHSRCPQ